MTPASIIPVFGSQRPYADLNFAGGSFGLDGRSVSDLTALPGFTFTRASLAMGYDATGKLTYGPNNLLLRSQEFGNALWIPSAASIASDTVTAPDGTLTADTLIEDTSASAHRLLPAVGNQMSFGIGAGMVYSLYVKSAGRDYAFIRINNSGGDIVAGNVRLADGVVTQTTSGTISTQLFANGWVRIAAYGVSANAAANTSVEVRCSNSATYANYTGDGTSGLFLWGAQLEAVTYQTTPSTYYPTTTAAYYGPRLVYDPVTLASQGILVEEARTNLILQSQTFGTTWTQTNVTVGDNVTTSPDGTTNADSLIETAAAAVNHRVTQSVTTTAAATTLSCYLKAGSRSWAFLRMSNSVPANCFAWINLATGALGTVSGTGATATVQSVGNGWYRLALTVATAVAGANTIVVAGSTGDNLQDYDGTNGLTAIYAFGAQVELGTGASSPIPTTTASVTRAADVPLLAVTGATYPMSVVATFTRAFDNGASDFVYQIDGGSSANRVTGTVNGSDQAASSMTTAGSGQGTSTSAATVSVGSLTKMATRFDTSAVQLALNGTLATPTSPVTLPSAPTTVRIGLNDTASNPGNLMLARLQIYNRALSDAQLQSLTT